jgi:hypothetical protein
VKGDSQLIVKQVKGDCSYNDPQLDAYLLHARKLERDFEVLDLQHIPRAENAVADDLPAKASTSAPVPDGVLERRLWQPAAWAANPSEGGETSTLKLATGPAAATTTRVGDVDGGPTGGAGDRSGSGHHQRS